MARDSRITNWITLCFSSLLIIAFAVFTGGAGCPVDDDVDDDDDDITGDDDTADDDDVVEPLSVTGMIYAIPVHYEQDEAENWARRELEWSDVNEDGYNLGLFYAAMTASRGSMDNPFVIDVPSDIPADPKNEGTAFSLVPEADDLPADLADVNIMAAVDSRHDTILSSRDGMVFYPETISVSGGPVTDLIIIVDVEYKWCDEWVVWFHGEACPVGCGSDGTVTLSGQEVLHGTPHTTAVGDAMVAVYSEGGGGPWWVTKPGEMDGANQDDYLPWELTACENYTAQVLGAWDWNNNMLFEPTDDWGITVDGIGGDVIHEWDLGVEDIGDMLIRMPESFGLPLWNPYVKISGVVQTDGSFEFADLADEDDVLIEARKGSPADLYAGESIGEAIAIGALYNYDIIENANAGGTELAYEVWVKPYSSAWLISSIEVGGNGNFLDNPEPDESVVHVEGENVVRNLTITNSP